MAREKCPQSLNEIRRIGVTFDVLCWHTPVQNECTSKRPSINEKKNPRREKEKARREVKRTQAFNFLDPSKTLSAMPMDFRKRVRRGKFCLIQASGAPPD